MGTVRIMHKGGNPESILLNHKACHAITAYLKQRPGVGHDGAFATRFKTPMTARAVVARDAVAASR